MLNVMASSDSAEGYTKTSERLVKDVGEPIVIKRSSLVPAEEGAIEKLKRLQRGG